MVEERNQEYQYQINQEYKKWKRHVGFLYDLTIVHALQDWPSLTFQWLPQMIQSIHYCIMGTHAQPGQKNYLLKAKVYLPNQQDQKRIFEQPAQKIECLTDIEQEKKKEEKKIQIQIKIIHQGQINRARYNPHAFNIIATKCNNGQVHIFDYFKHTSRPQIGQTLSKPQLRLLGHDKQGYGLSWNQQKPNLLLSGAYDSKVLMWDIQHALGINQSISPMGSFNFHKGDVQDVQWHPFHGDVFASVGGDRIFALWDTRTKSQSIEQKKKPVISSIVHRGQIYTMDWNPFNQYLYLTGSEDKEVSLWDLRNPTKRLHYMVEHINSIRKVQWSPHNIGICASASDDRRVVLWDLSRIGQTNKNKQKCNELLVRLNNQFVHAGHRGSVLDMDWNLNEKLVIGSVQDSNIVQVWQMSRQIYYNQQKESKQK